MHWLTVCVQMNWKLSSISPGHIGPTVYVCDVHRKSRASERSQSAVHTDILDWYVCNASLLTMLETCIFLPYLEGRGDCNSKTWESSKKKKGKKELMRAFVSWLILLFWICCHILSQSSIYFPLHSRSTAAPGSSRRTLPVLSSRNNVQCRFSGWWRSMLLEAVSELQSREEQPNCSWENARHYLAAAHCATSAFNKQWNNFT